jgi:predicted Zn-dependent protease
MIRRLYWKTLVAVVLYASTGYGQTYQISPNPQAPGYDYFNPEPGGSSTTYRDLVTSAHTDKILGWVQNGRMQDAINDVVYTLDRFANHPKGLQMAGMVATMIKRPSLATYYFERAVKIYPQYAITHAQYGAYLLNAGDIDDAIARLKVVTEGDFKSPGAYALLARAYTKKGDLEAAQQAAAKARELGYRGETP